MIGCLEECVRLSVITDGTFPKIFSLVSGRVERLEHGSLEIAGQIVQVGELLYFRYCTT